MIFNKIKLYTIFHTIYFALFICALHISSTKTALANDLTLIHRFGYWDIYSEIDAQGKNICHIISIPVETKAYDGLRNLPYFVVTYYDPNMYTVSTYSGFGLDKTKEFTVKANNKFFALKIARDYFAYTYNSADDVRLVNNMMENSSNALEVRSNGRDGGTSVDFYSLYGFSKAIKYVQKKCQ